MKAHTCIKSALNLNKLSASAVLAGLLFLAVPGLFASEALNSLFSAAPAAGGLVLAEPEAPAPAPIPYAAARPLKAWFISVGQGDAEYLELPGGKTVLIDGGPQDPDKPGFPPVAKFLSQHKVTKIDYVVLTHPHADHYEGLEYVFANIKVGHFYDTRMNNTGAIGDEDLRSLVKKTGVPTSYPAAGDTLAWDPAVQVNVFHGCPEPVSPQAEQESLGSIINDSSIVLKVTYQNTSILYTGDIQDDMLPALELKFKGQLQSDILKVSHHGSRYATGDQFLNLVKPKAAYIEVGPNNFGHPADATLKRLKAAGTAVYRTDQSGTMEYDIGGN